MKFKILEERELIKALRAKLLEEVEELEKEIDPGKIIYEIADVLEAIECLSENLGISLKAILHAKQEKVKKSGSFRKGYFVYSVKIEKGHPSFSYYSERPDKYPEIKGCVS